jgi:hypothetical protein
MFFENKEFTGISLESDLLRLARIEVVNNKFKLKKLDQFSLVEEVFSTPQTEDIEHQQDEVDPPESVFGFDGGSDKEETKGVGLEEVEEEEGEIGTNMVEGTGETQSETKLLCTVL